MSVPLKLLVTPRLVDHETGEVLHECTVMQLPADHILGAHSWYWCCSCGGHGRVQSQSDSVSVFQWFKHAFRLENMMWPKDSAPAYRWLTQEKAARDAASNSRLRKKSLRSLEGSGMAPTMIDGA